MPSLTQLTLPSPRAYPAEHVELVKYLIQLLGSQNAHQNQLSSIYRNILERDYVITREGLHDLLSHVIVYPYFTVCQTECNV